MVYAKSETVDKTYLEALNNYIGEEILLSGKYAIPVLDKVRKQKRDANNLPIGVANSNTILDNRIYELEFPDGQIEEYSANVIAKNFLNMANADGWDTGLLEEIEDFRGDESIDVPIEKVFTEIFSGCQAPVITTKAWDVKFLWKDKSTNWIPLVEIKE